MEQYERRHAQCSRLVGGTNISKEPAAFILRVEVAGMCMWLGCIHRDSITWVVVA